MEDGLKVYKWVKVDEGEEYELIPASEEEKSQVLAIFELAQTSPPVSVCPISLTLKGTYIVCKQERQECITVHVINWCSNELYDLIYFLYYNARHGYDLGGYCEVWEVADGVVLRVVRTRNNKYLLIAYNAYRNNKILAFVEDCPPEDP